MRVLFVSEPTVGDRVDDIALVTLVNVLATMRVHQSISSLAGTLVRAISVDALLLTQIGTLRTLVNVDAILS